MMTDDITVADVEAMCDVIDTITEVSDQTPLDTAAELRLALQAVVAKARAAVGLLETQMMNQLEDAPRRIGDFTYEVVNDGAYRADHDVILATARARAFREAVNPETGEVDSGRALEHFERYVRALYLSPSSWVKVGGLQAVGFVTKDEQKTARRWENKGRKLAVIAHDTEGRAT